MFIALKIVITISYLTLGFVCLIKIKKLAKKSMYSYTIVSLLGVFVFFLVGTLINFLQLGLLVFVPYSYGLMEFYTQLVSTFSIFIYFAFPPVLIFSVFLIISNIILLAKEGLSVTNIVGFVLGGGLVTWTLLTTSIMNGGVSFKIFSYYGYYLSIAMESLFATLLCYVECMMVATIFVAIKSARRKPNNDKDCVIILGCYVRADGRPGKVLKDRVDTALEFIRNEEKTSKIFPKIIASGGKGKDEPIPEAESMRTYLVEQRRFEPKRIILEAESKTTRQNFINSKELVNKDQKVAFATTDFHVFRSGVIATKCGYNNIEGMGAKSPWYFYNNSLIREFVANLNSERKMHIFNLVAINFVLSVLLMISYHFHIM